MLYYCLECRKNTENKNSKNVKRKNKKIMLLLNCEKYGREKSKYIKE